MIQPKKAAAALVVSAAALFAWGTMESGSPAKPPLMAYQDSVGVQTICHGHTKGVTRGMRATLSQCEQWLKEDASDAGRIVGQWVAVPITQDQYDALVLFVGNLGTGRPGVKDGFVWLKTRDRQGIARHSSLLIKVNQGDCRGAAAEFLKWDKAGGKRLRGLTTRRLFESALFAKGCEV